MKNLLIGAVCCCSSFLNAQEPDTTYKPVEYPAGFTAQLNVVYTKVKDWEGKMDIYLPRKAKPITVGYQYSWRWLEPWSERITNRV